MMFLDTSASFILINKKFADENILKYVLISK